MIAQARSAFNQQFSERKYLDYLRYLEKDFPNALDFRVAETPIFIKSSFLAEMQECCDYIIDQLHSPGFMGKTASAIPENRNVPGKEGHPHFLIFDFGICEDGQGGYFPQLVEMQGFPTLFAYQLHQYRGAAAAYDMPTGFTPFMNGFDEQKVRLLLGNLLKGKNNSINQSPHTVLLEIFPERQKTRIDFLYTEKYFGIPTVCITELKKVGNELFYIRDGKNIKIDRIYNRFIFDELTNQDPEVQQQSTILFEPLDISWVTHPNWFYRLSKFTLPFLSDKRIPETKFLSEYKKFPADLENYVLKPLFSFAGRGVIIDVQLEDLKAIPPNEYNKYILQKKVNYAPVIRTPDGMAKAEIRIFYIWDEDATTPTALCNLARLTKGNMVGVAQNKNKTWVGGSFALFEEKS